MQKTKLAEAIQEASKLPKEQQEAFVLEQLSENMPSDDFINAMFDRLAKTRWKSYNAYIKAGFSEDQALILCQK